MLLVGKEDGKKVAEVSLDKMPLSELQVLLEIWDETGRTFEYQSEVKPYKWPSFEKGK